MDGQRLRLTGGTYGADSSTYQTEVANFVNVTAHGSAGNGPAYWTAQDRNGRTYSYGNGGGSQVLLGSTAVSWQLNEVSDPPGNTMTIAYTAATGAVVPSTISWTPSSHGSSSYNYTMNFAYGTNNSQTSIYGYVAGTAVTNTNLLQSISIAYLGTTVKKYNLTYQTSSTTGRYELQQVQECSDSAGSNCLLPTVFTYQSGAAGVSTSGTQITSAGGNVYALYDFNGDGYPDILYSNGGTWYVAFGSASGYGTPVSTGISLGTAMLPGDLLGTGTDGLLANNGGTWFYYTWNGSSFAGTTTGLAYDSSGQFLLADINGDGRPDLIEVTWTQKVALHITTRLNTSSGTSVSFGSAVDAYDLSDANLNNQNVMSATTGATTLGKLRRFDFNGDGREDLMLQYQDVITVLGHTTHWFNTVELLSNGSTFTASTISRDSNSFTNLAFLDFNSDGCTDFVKTGASGTSLYVSGCNGSAASTMSLGSATVIGAMDWDGDGRTDILIANGSTVGVYLSTGVGLNLQTTSIPYNSNTVYFTFDANGDGLDAMGYYTTTGIGYYKHNGAGQPPDLLSSATDGYGNSASPTYVSLVKGNYSENGYGTPTFPDRLYMGPLYVVSEVVYSDPSSSSGGTYNNQFWYYGAWTNVQGRGFEGFYAISDTDSRNGLSDYRYFQRNFPYTWMQNERIVSNGSFYPTQWVGTLTYQTLSSTPYQQRYFPYFSSSTKYKKEVGGSENGDLITTESTSYTLDSYGNPTSISTTVTDNDPTSPYNGQTWTTTTTNTPVVNPPLSCTGLFTQTQVAFSSSLSGSNSVTRTKTMTPDTTNCRYTQIVTEPNSSQFKVTENISYDAFGNVNSDSVTGVGMGTASPATRTLTMNWTTSSVTTGQFPMNATDPNGAETQFNYNFSYGFLNSLTDPNNLTTSWQYTDGFGRPTQETRPDGTYTTWTYYDCAWSACPLGSHGIEITQAVYGVGGVAVTDSTTWRDTVDRMLVSAKRNLSGGYDRNEMRYDSLGRIAQQAFPCAYSAITTPCTYWTTNSYDVLNRLTQSQRPISSTNSTLQTTTYSYAGRTTTTTDPQSNARVMVSDVNGWLRQTKDPMGYNVVLAYDAAGSETKVTDSLGNTLWSGTYNYGLNPYLASATDMDLGAWTYTVDALGERTSWTDAKSQSFSATYDALSRPLTRTEPDLFSQWTWGSSASSHNIGQLQSACTGSGGSCSASAYSESEIYDSLGRPSQRTITLPGYSAFTYTLTYSGTTGLPNTLTYPTSTSGYALELQYAYSNGVLQSVTDISDTPNVTVWTANTMDPMGHVTKATLGNGIVTNRSFDAVTGWLGSAQSGVGGGSGVKNLSFLFDEMGNVTQRQDNNLGLTENIYYDNDYRFSYSTLNGPQNLKVTYDQMGNILTRTDVAGGAGPWTYDPTHKHQVTQAGSSAYQYSYDANGNAITRQGSTISWSSYNYPTTINAGSGSTAETVAFAYGPDRLRWQQMYVGNGTQETTNYVGKILEVVASGGVTDYRHYVSAAGEHVAVYSRKSNGTNTFNYLLSDQQASVASITNGSGGVVIAESFDAFGNRRNPTTWSGPPSNADLTTIAGITRDGYTFQTALGLWMGMNHMNGRVQDSVTGRFLSADPNTPDRTLTQSYNRYSYVNNNPLTFVDPTGFCMLTSPSDGACLDDGTGGGSSGFSGATGPYWTLNPPTNSFCVSADGGGYWCKDTDTYGSGSSPSGGGVGQPSQGGNGFGGGQGKPGTPPDNPPGNGGGPTGSDEAPLQTITVTADRKPPCSTATNVGNFLIDGADQFATLSNKLQMAGAAALAFGGPKLWGKGLALLMAGGAGQAFASALQEFGGIAQMIGGDDVSTGQANTLKGSGELLLAGVTGRLGGKYLHLPGNSVAERAFNSSMGKALALGGAAIDTINFLSPTMAPTLVTTCGP